MKPKLFVSVSGGRSSMMMGKIIFDRWSDYYDLLFLFANTGLEHEKTLEFVRNCEDFFGFNVVWVEAVVHHGSRVGCTHRVVDFESATRGPEVFSEVVTKYGLSNLNYLHCTRELKTNPMRSYAKSVGFGKAKIALGMRADEPRRVKDKKLKVIYPLAHDWPTTKPQVLSFWDKQPFDLGLLEFEGNCQGCFKKSLVKQFLQIDLDPSVFDSIRILEEKHLAGEKGAEERKWFRENNTTAELFELFKSFKKSEQSHFLFEYFSKEDGGCSESCEVFDMS